MSGAAAGAEDVEAEPWFHRRKSDTSSVLSGLSDEVESECQSDVIDHENESVEETELSSSLQNSRLDQVGFEDAPTPVQFPPLASPRTPRTTPRTPIVVECPGAPSVRTLRSKEMVRQSSLSETKLLMTTQLKRTYSNFLFDKHFDFLREIGRGSSSKVYEARDRRHGVLCAVKISKQPFFAREDRERFLREIQSVACLPEHPNVVKYYRGWQQDAHFHIQMELCDGGSLRNYLDALSQPLDENKVWCFIRQVASGLDHIHSHGVLHLDIKPENILICGDSEGTLKICDFGLAVQKQSLWDWEEGDGAYVAPELLMDQEPGAEADMFSFGVMVYEWATGEPLPRPNPEVEVQIASFPGRTAALTDLVRALLRLEPSRRPTAGEVLQWQSHKKGERLLI
ncbi:probable protein kinase DDB_G0291842 [Selaginella moellendorffii]|uniref:probable protein kinase DDB_G0291842 n=1 Tax=Selaginella moellendorffii TaxID=88036 RepID=UPI000D1CF0B2|nr:probable protein kinase DDB_G0291842 [Selaginella moellendorffii]|eukprot:XP_024519632.1 probable protein kinase DDB_G0291842 [Selaginella moellendorffii]